jgi:hypothetical protein
MPHRSTIRGYGIIILFELIWRGEVCITGCFSSSPGSSGIASGASSSRLRMRGLARAGPCLVASAGGDRPAGASDGFRDGIRCGYRGIGQAKWRSNAGGRSIRMRHSATIRSISRWCGVFAETRLSYRSRMVSLTWYSAILFCCGCGCRSQSGRFGESYDRVVCWWRWNRIMGG